MAKKKKPTRKPLHVEIFATCDSISRDPNSTKATLYGLFDVIWAEKFPTAFRPFSIYIEIVGDGKHSVTIDLRSPDGTSEKLFDAEIHCTPRGVVEAFLVGHAFQTPGEYQLVLKAKGRALGARRLEVKTKAQYEKTRKQ